LSSVRPDAVINAAAYAAVDACETDQATAYAVNADAVGFLSAACESSGAHLVHVSTDYVFDGTLDRPYREDDATNPQSVYGRSKLAGEIAAGPDAAVVRTSWVCGEHGNNMVKLVLRLAADPDQALAFVDDQRGHPTFTADLAPALRTLAIDRRSGIHHLTNDGAVSWYGFVREILGAAGHDPDRVRPIATADLQPPRPAPRPANSVLDNAAWRAAGYPPLRHFREPLTELVARLQHAR
jgi:dTDP-4-dehydrorhamnose reductase